VDGYIQKTDRILDFGCGKGDDVRWLKKHNYRATGYDPNFKAFYKVINGQFDVVILSYVINTIEYADMREDAIRAAWGYVKPGGFLYVTSRSKEEIDSLAVKKSWPRSSDGYCSSLTKRTFQRGHNHAELCAYIKPLNPIETFAFPAPYENIMAAKGRWS
jgi:DNA phosphorothioation-associated putative methyltransferase